MTKDKNQVHSFHIEILCPAIPQQIALEYTKLLMTETFNVSELYCHLRKSVDTLLINTPISEKILSPSLSKMSKNSSLIREMSSGCPVIIWFRINCKLQVHTACVRKKVIFRIKSELYPLSLIIISMFFWMCSDQKIGGFNYLASHAQSWNMFHHSSPGDKRPPARCLLGTLCLALNRKCQKSWHQGLR